MHPLADGTALRPSDVDLVKIHGYGFPRWRGGPMHHAEAHGLDAVVETLRGLAGEGLAEPPCDRLLEAARRGGFSEVRR